MASGSSTAVEHLPHHTKVKGSRPVTATGTGETKKWKKSFYQESFIRLPMESFIYQHILSLRQCQGLDLNPRSWVIEASVKPLCYSQWHSIR
jgi:hypothetical protein